MYTAHVIHLDTIYMWAIDIHIIYIMYIAHTHLNTIYKRPVIPKVHIISASHILQLSLFLCTLQGLWLWCGMASRFWGDVAMSCMLTGMGSMPALMVGGSPYVDVEKP